MARGHASPSITDSHPRSGAAQRTRLPVLVPKRGCIVANDRGTSVNTTLSIAGKRPGMNMPA